MKIVVVGLGYVGMANSVVLAQNNSVTAVDIDKRRVEMVNDRISPIVDTDLTEYLRTRDLDLNATDDECLVYADAKFVVVATPTNYDPVNNSFDTTSVETVIDNVLTVNQEAVIIIKSTVPVGFTMRMRQRYPGASIIFSPEFLREGRALYDNLYPSRVVVGAVHGDDTESARTFAKLLLDGAVAHDVPVLVTEPTEAEAIKLFSNTYLALRVAYFNELDTYAMRHGLEAGQIIEGVSLDPRIGSGYNNPSFGYGGYCLPKDTKQLRANYWDVPQNLISAIVDANQTRKDFIASDIISRGPSTVGIHRLTMKSSSDNFRESAVLGVIRRLVSADIEVIVYEPSLTESDLFGAAVVPDLEEFKARATLIVANRMSVELTDVADRVYSRDIYGRD